MKKIFMFVIVMILFLTVGIGYAKEHNVYVVNSLENMNDYDNHLILKNIESNTTGNIVYVWFDNYSEDQKRVLANLSAVWLHDQNNKLLDFFGGSIFNQSQCFFEKLVNDKLVFTICFFDGYSENIKLYLQNDYARIKLPELKIEKFDDGVVAVSYVMDSCIEKYKIPSGLFHLTLLDSKDNYDVIIPAKFKSGDRKIDFNENFKVYINNLIDIKINNKKVEDVKY